LCLKHAGFESNAPIYINECLTKANQALLKAAIAHKKHDRVTSAFSFRGSIFVKKTKEGNATKIESIQELDSIAMSAVAIVASTNSQNSAAAAGIINDLQNTSSLSEY